MTAIHHHLTHTSSSNPPLFAGSKDIDFSSASNNNDKRIGRPSTEYQSPAEELITRLKGRNGVLITDASANSIYPGPINICIRDDLWLMTRVEGVAVFRRRVRKFAVGCVCVGKVDGLVGRSESGFVGFLLKVV